MHDGRGPCGRVHIHGDRAVTNDPRPDGKARLNEIVPFPSPVRNSAMGGPAAEIPRLRSQSCTR